MASPLDLMLSPLDLMLSPLDLMLSPLGLMASPLGSDAFTIGSDGYTIGSNAFTIGSNAFTIGSDAFTIGPDGFTIGFDGFTPRSGRTEFRTTLARMPDNAHTHAGRRLHACRTTLARVRGHARTALDEARTGPDRHARLSPYCRRDARVFTCTPGINPSIVLSDDGSPGASSVGLHGEEVGAVTRTLAGSTVKRVNRPVFRLSSLSSA